MIDKYINLEKKGIITFEQFQRQVPVLKPLHVYDAKYPISSMVNVKEQLGLHLPEREKKLNVMEKN